MIIIQSVPHGSNLSYTELHNLKSNSDTFLKQFEYETFAFITLERLCQSRYNILVSRALERLWGLLVIKFKLARSEVLTAVLLIPQVIRNIYCVDC